MMKLTVIQASLDAERSVATVASFAPASSSTLCSRFTSADAGPDQRLR
jgi:hypothetical protein